MKKTISVLLAITMLFAMCVPAFAAEITKADVDGGHPSKDVTVLVNGASTGAETYKVTIPAEVTVSWNTTAPALESYKVESNLKLGAKLKVKVTAANSGNMIVAGDSAAAPTKPHLTLSVSANAESTFAEVNATGTTPSAAPTIAISGYDTAPIADYTGQLTYTVTYVDPPVAP